MFLCSLPVLQCRGWCCKRSWPASGWFWGPEEAPRCCGTSGTGEQGSPRSPDIAFPLMFQLWRPLARCTLVPQASLHKDRVQISLCYWFNFFIFFSFIWWLTWRVKLSNLANIHDKLAAPEVMPWRNRIYFRIYFFFSCQQLKEKVDTSLISLQYLWSYSQKHCVA